MKKFNLSTFVALLGLTLLASCEVDDNINANLLEDVGRGAILRTLGQTGTALDVLNLDASTTIMLEEQDDQNGALLDVVNVFVNFIDQTPDDVQSPAETLFTTIAADAFENGPFGLPRADFSASLGQMLTTLGLTAGQFNCGDAIDIRMELVLTDGRVFTDTNATGNIPAIGSFFSSPYLYRRNIVANLPSDTLFEGSYLLETSGPDALVPNFAEDFVDGVYESTTVNNTTKLLNDVLILGGGFGALDIQYIFLCGDIVFSALDFGLSCGETNGLINTAAVTNSNYDLLNPDDSLFTINYTSNSEAECVAAGLSAGPTQSSITLTRQ